MEAVHLREWEMKNLVSIIIFLLIAGFLYLSYIKEKDPKEEISAAGHPAELADTTRLDSALEDAVSDTADGW